MAMWASRWSSAVGFDGLGLQFAGGGEQAHGSSNGEEAAAVLLDVAGGFMVKCNGHKVRLGAGHGGLRIKG